MKCLIFTFILLLSISNANAQFKTIFADTNIVKHQIMGLTVFDDNSMSLWTYFAIAGEEPHTWTALGGNLLSTSDAGMTWDTLRRWVISEEEYIREWSEIKATFYFDKNTYCVFHNDGKLLRYDLLNKQCDTTQLLDPQMADSTKVIYYNRVGSNIAVLSSYYENKVHITNNSGKNWDTIYRPYAAIPKWPLPVPAHLTVMPNGKDIYQLRREVIRNPFGYVKDGFKQIGDIYKADEKKWENILLGDNAFLGTPTFINDSVGFIPGHKCYFQEIDPDTIDIHAFPYDSIFTRPVIFKTTDGGVTWNNVYEADSFCGNNETGIKRKGDTLVLCYYGTYVSTTDYQSFGYIISTDMGITWKRVSMSYIKPTGCKVIAFSLTKDVSKPILVLNKDSDYMLDQLTIDFVSVKEENPFAPTANVYPNPASEFVSIDFDGISDLPESVEVFDILGNRSSGIQVFKTAGSVMINTSQLSSGIYTVRISAGESVIVKSFVVGR